MNECTFEIGRISVMRVCETKRVRLDLYGTPCKNKLEGQCYLAPCLLNTRIRQLSKLTYWWICSILESSWTAIIRIVLRLNFLLRLLKSSSKFGPKRSITSALYLPPQVPKWWIFGTPTVPWDKFWKGIFNMILIFFFFFKTSRFFENLYNYLTLKVCLSFP